MAQKRTKPRLSKSRFVAGLQCLKRLYLMVNEPETGAEISAAVQAILDQGKEVGNLATQLFKGGVLVDADHKHSREAVETTEMLIEDTKVPAIFEAGFTHDNIHVRVDILERLAGSKWHLIEVKSTTEVKDYHLPDAAIQKYVLEKSGLKVARASLMHLNRDYVYDGKKYVLKKLFKIAAVTTDIKALEKELPKRIAEQRLVLMNKRPPKIEPGRQCTKPFACEFYDRCNLEQPADWIGNLYRISESKMAELQAQGIDSIKDIPESFQLSAIQQRMRECARKKKPFFSATLTEKLAELAPPVYFMDFETINPALPWHKGMRPFDQLPFQWSVHVMTRNGAKVKHYEFLHNADGDPRGPFLKELLAVLEEHARAPIIVYNQGFESGRLNELAGWFPAYAGRIKRVQKRLWDLLPVVREHVYHPKFRGSFSIKSVLPALVPGMTYTGMGVADGAQAGVAYLKMLQEDTPKLEKKRIRSNLLQYCEQDTLAMVMLIDSLKRK